MAFISEVISHKLAQKGVIAYLLDYLGHPVNPGTNINFASHHICLCKSSHLCIKLSSSFMPLWETNSWLTNQLNMTRMFTLLPGSSWTWGWCFCLLGGTEFLLCFSSPLSLKLQELFFPDVHDCLGFSTSCARLLYWFLLAGGEVGFLTYIWSGTFTSPTVINSHALPASRTLDNLMGPGDGNIISGWQGLASLNPFVLSCTILDKFYCLTFRTEFGARRSKNRTPGPGGT